MDRISSQVPRYHYRSLLSAPLPSSSALMRVSSWNRDREIKSPNNVLGQDYILQTFTELSTLQHAGSIHWSFLSPNMLRSMINAWFINRPLLRMVSMRGILGRRLRLWFASCWAILHIIISWIYNDKRRQLHCIPKAMNVTDEMAALFYTSNIPCVNITPIRTFTSMNIGWHRC